MKTVADYVRTIPDFPLQKKRCPKRTALFFYFPS